MAYDTAGKRRRTENLAGQVSATAWNCCHKITFAFPFDDIDNWRSSLERRVQSAEHVADNLNQYTSIEQSTNLSSVALAKEDRTISHPLYDADGVTTEYAYDAAGRLVKEGNKTYSYGYLDKVLSVTEGAKTYAYDYHVDGQLARASYGDDGRARTPAAPQMAAPVATEDFAWDGLALIRRGDERFVNEPHVGGGNPVASSKGTTYFNDLLGTTVGAKAKGKYAAAALTAFGEPLPGGGTAPAPFFTGKPQVEGLGHAFLMRNYRAGLAKWQTADPMGYPDGWNQLVYCNNLVTGAVDLWGGIAITAEFIEEENRRCEVERDRIRSSFTGLTIEWKEVVRGFSVKSDETELNVMYTQWERLNADYDYRFKDWDASWVTYDYLEVLWIIPKGGLRLFVEDIEKLTYVFGLLSSAHIVFKIASFVNQGISGYNLFISTDEDREVHVGYHYYNIVPHQTEKHRTEFRKREE